MGIKGCCDGKSKTSPKKGHNNYVHTYVRSWTNWQLFVDATNNYTFSSLLCPLKRLIVHEVASIRSIDIACEYISNITKIMSCSIMLDSLEDN